MKSTTFEMLPLAKKKPKHPNYTRYRVYKNAKEFTLVEAESAKQALEASGVAQPLRIVPDSLDVDGVLEEQAFAKELAEEVVEAIKEQIPAAPEPAAAAPAADQDTPKSA